jgi:hypothetical protein
MDSTMTRKGKEKNLYKDKTRYGQKRVRQVEKLLEKREAFGNKKDKNHRDKKDKYK